MAHSPAVSYVKPDGLMDGHPASSKWGLFEAFAQNIIELAQSNPEQWAETAIFVTVDEGGGFYDSGFIQPVDFFGTGPRIPMIAVSPFSEGGHISHTYSEHSSVVKFIERNWELDTKLSTPAAATTYPTLSKTTTHMCRATCPPSATCSTCSTLITMTAKITTKMEISMAIRTGVVITTTKRRPTISPV